MPQFKAGDTLKAKVTAIENYGVFVSAPNRFTGLIHISEISDDYVRNINNYLAIGDEIKAEIISVDEENKRLQLTVKRFKLIDKTHPNKLPETALGFEPLADMLPIWQKEKLNEIRNTTNK